MRIGKLLFTTISIVVLLTSLSFSSSIDVTDQYDFNLALNYAFGPANIDTLVLVTSGGVYTTTDTVYMKILKPILFL